MAAPSAAPPGLGAEAPAARRLVAILHADVVGYSRLVQLDELGTLSRLRAVRDGLVAPLIGAGGGRGPARCSSVGPCSAATSATCSRTACVA